MAHISTVHGTFSLRTANNCLQVPFLKHLKTFIRVALKKIRMPASKLSITKIRTK